MQGEKISFKIIVILIFNVILIVHFYIFIPLIINIVLYHFQQRKLIVICLTFLFSLVLYL